MVEGTGERFLSGSEAGAVSQKEIAHDCNQMLSGAMAKNGHRADLEQSVKGRSQQLIEFIARLQTIQSKDVLINSLRNAETLCPATVAGSFMGMCRISLDSSAPLQHDL